MAIHVADVLTEHNHERVVAGAPQISRENEPRPDSALTLASMGLASSDPRSVGRLRL